MRRKSQRSKYRRKDHSKSYLGQRKRTQDIQQDLVCVELEEHGTNVTAREVRASRRAARWLAALRVVDRATLAAHPTPQNRSYHTTLPPTPRR